MDLELGIRERQLEKDNELVKELIQARDMNLSKHKQIKDAVEKDEKYAGFPVVHLGKQSINEIQQLHEKTIKDLASNTRKLRAFGAAINLDGSNAANIDRATSKAKREGLDSSKEKAMVRKVTLDHTQVYRNSTDVEKDMGIARESMYRVDTPDRNMVDNVMKNVVTMPIEPVIDMDSYINEKYAKWNKEREEKEKEFEREERARLERETRDEIDFDNYLPNPHLLSR